MDQLIADVTRNVTEKWLPTISEKYDIPLEELMDLVVSKSVRTTTKEQPVVKLTPKKLADLQLKIQSARDQGKILNVTTGRPVADSPANRKKLTFFPELGIAGQQTDQKFKEALASLGAPVKQEVPVHKQAEKAKARAGRAGTQSSDTESDKQLSMDDEPDVPLKSVADSKSSSETEEPVVIKQSVNGKKRLAKKLSDLKSSNSSEAQTDESESMSAVLKLSKLVDENDSAEESPQPVKTSTKPTASYNPKARAWINQETHLVVKNPGLKAVIIGRLTPQNETVPLTAADVKICEKRGWNYKV